MRLFQNVTVYRSYAPRLRALTGAQTAFSAKMAAFIDDRYGAAHLLQPVLARHPDAFLAVGNDPHLQGAWAVENGLKRGTATDDVLLAQIEHHRSEVFYTTDPILFPDAFVRRLPGCVRRTIAWRAAPSPHHDFFSYDLVISNFPAILRTYADGGARTAPFFPSHDPELDDQAANRDRRVDVLFVGGYGQYHRERALLLEQVAALQGRFQIAFHLDGSRLSRLADRWFGRIPPLSRHRRPDGVRRVDHGPVFGRAFHAALGSAKIVLNGAIDMAGHERGNIRCFEALGAGCLMVSDEGIYPTGFEAGRNFLSYRSREQAVDMIVGALEDYDAAALLAAAGHAMVATQYSKERQWEAFQQLV
jgi:glycosyl transferase family 1